MKPRIREIPIQAWGLREESVFGAGVVVDGRDDGEDEDKDGWASRMPTTPGVVGVRGGSFEWTDSGLRSELSGREGLGVSEEPSSSRLGRCISERCCHRTSRYCGE